ncbi:hypothetical protein ABIB96_004945 [Bradyrhizobium sp. LA3.X]
MHAALASCYRNKRSIAVNIIVIGRSAPQIVVRIGNGETSSR